MTVSLVGGAVANIARYDVNEKDRLDLLCLAMAWLGYGAIAAGYWFTHWQRTTHVRYGPEVARQAERRHHAWAVVLALVGGFLTFCAMVVAAQAGRLRLEKWWREARFYDLY